MEYWIVYDVATGAVLYRGEGSVGTARYQALPEGAALITVPHAVVASVELNLVALRTALAARVDADAEAMRMRFLTPGAGQAMTYQRKEAEARAYLADAGAPVPFLAAEAPARGMTIEALAVEVVDRANAWTAIGSTIEALRLGAKGGVEIATTLGSILAAATVTWPA
ncbi:hypothetical protein [Sphingomonas sp.]|uniref:hypothetical protein n=1 Tax=Sphingomonas sp. TaxID=28214 RepID=UPI002EDAE6BD